MIKSSNLLTVVTILVIFFFGSNVWLSVNSFYPASQFVPSLRVNPNEFSYSHSTFSKASFASSSKVCSLSFGMFGTLTVPTKNLTASVPIILSLLTIELIFD